MANEEFPKKMVVDLTEFGFGVREVNIISDVQKENQEPDAQEPETQEAGAGEGEVSGGGADLDNLEGPTQSGASGGTVQQGDDF